MYCVGVIPARFNSVRLPGKPLALLGGKPMIQHVWERSLLSSSLDELLVATDDERIMNAVLEFGGKCVMTSPDAASGTDRAAEAVESIPADVVVNIQGDEPFVSPDVLDALTAVFEDEEVHMATPVRKADSNDDVSSPNSVKVVGDVQMNAIYFSRAPIPYHRVDGTARPADPASGYWIHTGIYAYRKGFLMELCNLEQTALEKAEKLEQLRVIAHGYKIRLVPTEYRSIPVDTEEDLRRAEEVCRQMVITEGGRA